MRALARETFRVIGAHESMVEWLGFFRLFQASLTFSTSPLALLALVLLLWCELLIEIIQRFAMAFAPPLLDADVDALIAEELAELLRDEDDATDSRSTPDNRSAVASSAANRAKRKLASRRNANKARDGRKAELAYLRRSVAELEARLEELRGSSVANDAGASSAPLPLAADHATAGEDRNVALWREIARHQSDERAKAERANARLRLVLENQLKIARSLEVFLQRKSSVAMADIARSVDVQHLLPNLLALHPDASPDRQHQVFGVDAEIYHALLAGAERSVRDVDAVFEANGLARTTTPGVNAQMHADQDAGVRIEVCATNLLPFSVHETAAAVWNHFLFAKRQLPMRKYTYNQHKSVDAAEDTVIEDFTLELQVKNASLHLRVRQVLRRSVEEDRIVVVWHTYYDPVEFSTKRLSGLRFLEKGYVMVKQHPSNPSSGTAPPCTLLQPCYIMSPLHVEGGGDADDIVGAITDFMLSATAIKIAATHQMVENVLVEQALGKRSLLE